MTKRTIILDIELTTDEPDETLLDPKLWAKAVGVFKADVTVHRVSSDDLDVPLRKPAKKKATKKTVKKKTGRKG